MPHLVLAGSPDYERLVSGLETAVARWGRAVLKVERCWLRDDRRALLVEGVVVELARPLHPVALLSDRRGDAVLRLWPLVAVERTPAVQRWLAVVASALQGLGAGRLLTTNLTAELVADLE